MENAKIIAMFHDYSSVLQKDCLSTEQDIFCIEPVKIIDIDYDHQCRPIMILGDIVQPGGIVMLLVILDYQYKFLVYNNRVTSVVAYYNRDDKVAEIRFAGLWDYPDVIPGFISSEAIANFLKTNEVEME